MFKVIDEPQFVEDVRVDMPDGTGWRQEILRTRFRIPRVSDLDALEEAGGAIAVLERIVVSFEDLVDEAGKPVDGAGEWREKLLGYGFIRLALIKAFYAAQSGLRLGNSVPSAAPGPAAH